MTHHDAIKRAAKAVDFARMTNQAKGISGEPALSLVWLTALPERVGDEAEFEVLRDVFKPAVRFRVIRELSGLKRTELT